MKMFKCTSPGGYVIRFKDEIELAAALGWELGAVGYEVLDQLEVGETTIDDDGDTWERVE